MGFRAEKNPVNRHCLRWIAERPDRHLDCSFGAFEGKPLDRPLGTNGNVMPACAAQTSGDYAADTAKAHDCNC
jgi:hypothetical protein